MSIKHKLKNDDQKSKFIVKPTKILGFSLKLGYFDFDSNEILNLCQQRFHFIYEMLNAN